MSADDPFLAIQDEIVMITDILKISFTLLRSLTEENKHLHSQMNAMQAQIDLKQRGEFRMNKPGTPVWIVDFRPPLPLTWWKRLLGYKQPQPGPRPKDMSKYEFIYYVELHDEGVTDAIKAFFISEKLSSFPDATLVLIDAHQISVLRDRTNA